jgi:hypothetical protein
MPANFSNRNTRKGGKLKIRRDSLKSLAGQKAFKLVATCTGWGSHLETNTDLMDILTRLTDPKAIAVLNPEDMSQEFEMLLDFGEEVWDCVGVVVSIEYLKNTGISGRHAKPYIKIGTDWFDGDNELGYLRKRRSPPSIHMPLKILNTPVPEGSIVKASLFYKERRFLTEQRTGANWVGKPTFGQIGSSCGPDAVLSVLMYADGFHEIFNKGMYMAMKPHIDARFSYNSVKAEPYTEAELKTEYDKLITLLPIKHTGPLNIMDGTRVAYSFSEKNVQEALSLLVYYFIRFYTIETMTTRNYEVSNNANSYGGKRKSGSVKYR